MNVAYFLSEFPALNETFVINELYYLQLRGIGGTIYYEQPGVTRPVQPRVRELRFAKFHIKYLGKLLAHPLLLCRSQWELLSRSPVGYVKAVRAFFSIPSVSNLRYFIHATLLVKSLKRDNVSILFIHDAEGISIIGLFCGLLSGLPTGIIFHTHGLFADRRYLREKIDLTDFSVFQSHYSKEFAANYIDAAPLKLKKMYIVSSTGVDTSFFRPKRKSSEYKTTRTLRIISIARIEEMKGFDRLIYAIYTLKKKGIRVNCQIIGYGSKAHELARLIRSLHLEKIVTLLGPIAHTPRLIRLLDNADVFVLPSVVDAQGDRDMQPNVVKEAMAMKLIVITPDFGGIREVIQDGKNGLLLKNSDSGSLVQMIERVIGLSPQVSRAIRDLARKTIIEKYEAVAISNQLTETFQKYAKKNY